MAVIGEMLQLTIGDKTYTLPTGGEGTITKVQTSAGAHSTINVSSGAASFNVPTKTSHLTNDSGFITNAGVTSITTTAGAHTTKSSATGAVSFNVPTKTSHLTNDSGFITSYTDTKLQVAAVTSGTTYYPIVGTGTTAATRQYDTTGFVYVGTNGTTSAVGSAKLTLGNSTASGTANNKQGQLIIYGSTAYAHTISGAPTTARTLTLPNATGTIALTSDIPDVSGKIDTAGTGLSKSGTTLNHSNSVTAQTTQALYPIKIDAQGHVSAYGTAVTSLPASDVYSWAKASTKPTYTASEVGALPSTTVIPTITDTYSGTSSDGMSGKAVKSAIDALDATITGTAGAGKTLTAFSQTDGKVTATFGNISITKSQISDFPTIPDVSGKIDTAGTGLSKSGTTLNHSNSVTAQTTQAVYPIKIDAQGHISAYGTAVTSMPASDVYSWAKASSKPTYTASEVGAATSGHTHTTSIATSTGTNQITLAANTKYVLTAGGTTYIFTTPPDTNTTYTASTTSIGSASAGTAIAADDITAWTTNTPTAVTKKTVVTSASGATATVANGVLTLTNGSFGTGDSVTVTAGTAASLSYTARSIPNISVTSKTVATGITAN